MFCLSSKRYRATYQFFLLFFLRKFLVNYSWHFEQVYTYSDMKYTKRSNMSCGDDQQNKHWLNGAQLYSRNNFITVLFILCFIID